MEKLKKFLFNLLVVAYAIIAISVTILLLSYNEYHHSVIGDYTFVKLSDDELEEYGYDEGALLIVKATKPKNVKPGDYIFLYRKISASQIEVRYAQVLLKDESRGEYDVSYVLEGGTVLNHADVIGSTKDLKVIPHLGTVLSILESRYGYLFLIVVVSFIAFLYEIYELIMEIKYGDKEDDEEDYEDDEEYDDEYDDEDEYEEEEVVVKPRRTTTKAATAKTVAPKKSSTTRKTTATTAKKPASTTTKTTRATAEKKTVAKKSEPAKKSTTAKTATVKTATVKTATVKTTTARKTSTTKKAGTTK